MCIRDRLAIRCKGWLSSSLPVCQFIPPAAVFFVAVPRKYILLFIENIFIISFQLFKLVVFPVIVQVSLSQLRTGLLTFGPYWPMYGHCFFPSFLLPSLPHILHSFSIFLSSFLSPNGFLLMLYNLLYWSPYLFSSIIFFNIFLSWFPILQLFSCSESEISQHKERCGWDGIYTVSYTHLDVYKRQ